MDSLMWHVMDATADDWESLEQILPHVREFQGPIEASAIAKLIAQLVAEGLMEEEQHSNPDPVAVLSDPTRFWFGMTSKGRELWDQHGTQYRGE